MKPHNKETESRYFAFLHYGTSLLGAGIRHVMKRFAACPMGINTYVRQGMKTRIIEIDLLEYGITLHGVFINSRRCNSSHIFFEDESILRNFEEYLHTAYEYDKTGQKWMLPEGPLEIKENDSIFFMEFSLKKE